MKSPLVPSPSSKTDDDGPKRLTSDPQTVLERIARFGEAFTAARDSVPVRKGHSHAGDAMVAVLARYARDALNGRVIPAAASVENGDKS